MTRKFHTGDKVFLSKRCPTYLDELRYRVRTIVNVRYIPDLQACMYALGENNKTQKAALGFRSYELSPVSKMRPKGRPSKRRRARHGYRHA